MTAAELNHEYWLLDADIPYREKRLSSAGRELPVPLCPPAYTGGDGNGESPSSGERDR